jgi:hypothetical protein
LLDSNVASGTKNGYVFAYVPTNGGATNSSFKLNADPANPGSGQRHFYTDETDVLRVNILVAASASDPAL